jgi:putative oxidoreductase
MKKLLFSTKPFAIDFALALLRVGSAGMMLTHGWAKIADFTNKLGTFSDPLGLGPAVSLQLAIFSEFFCAILLLLGFMTRISLIPLSITMFVAAFMAHADDPFPSKEKALLFLLIFVVLSITGPGRLSLDAQINRKRY